MSDSAEEFAQQMNRPIPSWADMRANADHADDAYRFLASAPFNGDAAMAKVMVDAATVHATLALHDKVGELCETLKKVIGDSLDTNAELSQTIKTATRAVVTELRQATVKAVA